LPKPDIVPATKEAIGRNTPYLYEALAEALKRGKCTEAERFEPQERHDQVGIGTRVDSFQYDAVLSGEPLLKPSDHFENSLSDDMGACSNGTVAI
jgi:hypothetical protein